MNTRKTKQKQVILNVLSNTTSHPTADWIYEEARKVLPKISKGTVYRNLKSLSESGRIVELRIDKTARRYDANNHNHYHLKCEDCENVYDLEVPVNKDLDRWISEEAGVTINGHTIEFFGLCRDCLAKAHR
jgi:Fur family peroxide stress response transcriptional regulator